ncbi:MAG: SPOR domain-containing protein [Gammaproteobacteria bacterium]|nr:SPOR domain-containing protein [Gammaproteobacteria bacterium]
MPRDYAKRVNSKKKNNRKKSAGKRRVKIKIRWKMWLVTLIAITCFAFLLHLLSRHHEVKLKPVVKIKKPVLHKHKAVHFDFYTILKDEKVPVNTAPISNNRYFLQVASFKSNAEADRLKAELALLGFDANIEQITEGGELWSRVSVGPYSTKSAALADKENLVKNNIDSVLKVID